MRSTRALAAAGLASVMAATPVIANPLGIPPTAKPFDVVEGKTISIELGTPTAHGWGFVPPAGAHGVFYYRVDNAP